VHTFLVDCICIEVIVVHPPPADVRHRLLNVRRQQQQQGHYTRCEAGADMRMFAMAE
jgi:hypothetical protein